MTHTRQLPTSPVGKGLATLAYLMREPARGLRTLTRTLASAYRERVAAESPIPEVALGDLVPATTEARLLDCAGRDGNVSLQELLTIATLVAARAPRRLLEIGTFDGNTTLQMAHNSPADARVFTLDLPPDPSAAHGHLEAADVAYITDAGKQARKYARHPVGAKVTQWLGDSATFDLTTAGGAFDFAFIDGSHSYDYVRSDTERVLPLMAPGGVVLWHDYTPAWPCVIRYLDARAHGLGLRRIAGTTLVCRVG